MMITQHLLMRKAFTLFELLIVIFLLSLFAYMGSDVMFRKNRSQSALTPETLRKIMTSTFSKDEEGILLCTGECSRCYIKHENEARFSPLQEKVALNSLEVYQFDGNGHLQKRTYDVTFQDRPVCLIMRHYAGGAVSPVILKTSQGVYFIPSYIGETTEYKTLQEAQKAHAAFYAQLRRKDFY